MCANNRGLNYEYGNNVFYCVVRVRLSLYGRVLSLDCHKVVKEVTGAADAAPGFFMPIRSVFVSSVVPESGFLVECDPVSRD